MIIVLMVFYVEMSSIKIYLKDVIFVYDWVVINEGSVYN